MSWHVVCQVGEDDQFMPALRPQDPRLVVALANPGSPYQVGNNVLETIYKNGLELGNAEIDLLHFAMAVYTADLRIQRSTAEDRWMREMILYLPVSRLERWEAALPTINRMLSFLTGDKWTVRPRPRAALQTPELKKSAKSRPALVTLFSGGLDSFVGAVDLLEDSEGLVALVGQYGKGSTHPSQVRSHKVVAEHYPERTLPLGFYVQPAKLEGQEAEDTMRSRSILFLALGTAVARASGEGAPLYVSENGLISLNVPLTYSRMGSLSTRTTHPYLISLYGQVLAELGIRVDVKLPYWFSTKGEMLSGAKNQDVLRDGLPATLSCARPDAGRFQKRPPGTHCGYCVPCIIRLASMRAAGFETRRAVFTDVIKERPAPDSAQGTDVHAFRIAIERVKTLGPLQLVGEVLHTGPLPPGDVREFAAVYKRGIEEVGKFLNTGRKK
jgi:hypothetical protein